MNQKIANAMFNHLSFPSNDVGATTSFFEKYLGFTTLMNEAPRFAILKRPGLDVVIEGANEHAPTPEALADVGSDAPFRDCVNEAYENPKWPIAFHIGLEFPSVEDVHEVRDALAADGFKAETDIYNNNRGSRFFLRAPGGVLCEFNTRADGGDAQFQAKFIK